MLSEREIALVRRLGAFRFLTVGQVAEFLFAGSTLRPSSRLVVARRVLARLRRAGLVVTNAHQAGEPDAQPTRLVHYLSTLGLRVFSELEPDVPLRRASVRGALLVAHALMVADIALAFRRSASAHTGHELELWECDSPMAAAHPRDARIVADARFVYASDRHRIHAFLEADRGTEGTRFFRGKVERYLTRFA